MDKSLFVKIIGLVFAAVGLYFISQSINAYIESCNQKDWPTATATVIHVEQRTESSGVKVRTHKTVYDVDYEYCVDEKVYSGTIYGTVDYSKQAGSTFEIKYNPQSPDESTNILSPSIPNLVLGIVSSCFFIIFSLLMTGVISFKQVSNTLTKKERQTNDTNTFSGR